MSQLQSLYMDKIKPCEEAYHFDSFYSPSWKSSDFDAKPMVLLLGQYSVGKTSFIRYLLGRDFPGARIGPEPTTDRFNAVLYGPEDRIIPGNALAVDQDMPFTSLTRFGTEFLNKFQASLCNSSLLKKVTFIDTPGVLSGEKQKLGRAYDFVKVTEWMAQRADMILLLFDAHKLDISDEFQAAIKALRGQDDKIRVVLNKADKITSQQLMRVYGAMMWSLGKVVNTPEVMRVYIGSFWDGACQNQDLQVMFRAEQSDLLKDLSELPRYAAVRKINELVKRARMARVHALIIGHLKSQMPSLFGANSKQKQLLENLSEEFFAVMKKHRLPQGDFPNLQRFKEVASTYDFGKFKKLDEKLLEKADDALATGIPALVRQLGEEQDARAAHERAVMSTLAEAGVAATDYVLPSQPEDIKLGGKGGPASPNDNNPFGAGGGARDPYAVWSAVVNRIDADSIFKMLPGGQSGTVSGAGAREVMIESGLEVGVLRQIWDLSDIDKDGFLDKDEFAVCWYLINQAKAGKILPATLPPNIIPPSKRATGGAGATEEPKEAA